THLPQVLPKRARCQHWCSSRTSRRRADFAGAESRTELPVVSSRRRLRRRFARFSRTARARPGGPLREEKHTCLSNRRSDRESKCKLWLQKCQANLFPFQSMKFSHSKAAGCYCRREC